MNPNNIQAFLQKGREALQNGQTVDAHNWFSLAANEGNAEAMWALACEVHPFTKSPQESRLYWYRKAANAGCFPAIEFLSHFLFARCHYFLHDPEGSKAAQERGVDYGKIEAWYCEALALAEIGAEADSLPCLRAIAESATRGCDSSKRERACRKLIALTSDSSSYEFAVSNLMSVFQSQKRHREEYCCAMILALLHDNLSLIYDFHTPMAISEIDACKADIQSLSLHF